MKHPDDDWSPKKHLWILGILGALTVAAIVTLLISGCTTTAGHDVCYFCVNRQFPVVEAISDAIKKPSPTSPDGGSSTQSTLRSEGGSPGESGEGVQRR